MPDSEIEMLRQRITELEAERHRYQEREKTLRNVVDLFRTVADSSYHWMHWIDQEGRYLYVSPACERISGYSPQAFKEDPTLFLKIVHPSDRARIIQHFKEELHGMQPANIDFRIVRKNGEVRWINHVCQSVYGGDGRWIGRHANNQDITDRKETEERLKRRDRILEVVGNIAEEFLRTKEIHRNVNQLLKRIGEVTDVSRVFIFENEVGDDEQLYAVRRYEWAADDAVSFVDNPLVQRLSYEHPGVRRWKEILQQGEVVHGTRETFPEEEARIIMQLDVYAILVVPIFTGDEWWGVIGLDEDQPHQWSAVEIDAIKTVAGILGAAIQRHQFEAALERSEEERHRLYRAVEQSACSIVITRRSGEIEYVNPKFTEVSGYTFDEVRGKNPRVLKTSGTPPEEYEELWETILAGHEWWGEFHNRKKNGELFWESASISPIFNNEGEITHFLAVKEDITERKMVEDALRSNLQFLETLLNTIPNPVFYKDSSGRYRGYNNLFAKYLLGLPSHHNTDRLLYDVPDELASTQMSVDHEQDRQLLQEPGVLVYEYRYQCTDGIQRDFLVTKATFVDAKGDVAGIVGVMLDITERKKMEKAIQEANKHLAYSVKELERRNRDITRLNNQMQDELTMARQIQQSLLPPPVPRWPEIDLVCCNIPAREVGGDLFFYHSFLPPTGFDKPERYAVAIGDVSGKGMPAALLMAVSLASIRSIMNRGLSPGRLLASLDLTIADHTRSTRQNCALVYVDMLLNSVHFASPQPRGYTVRVANAGCIPPLIKRQSGEVEWVDIGGVPLGVGLGNQSGYQELELTIHRGEYIVLTSDGVVEATNKDREMFGFGRLEESVRTAPDTNADALLRYLRTAVESFVGDVEQSDDMTMAIIHV